MPTVNSGATGTAAGRRPAAPAFAAEEVAKLEPNIEVTEVLDRNISLAAAAAPRR